MRRVWRSSDSTLPLEHARELLDRSAAAAPVQELELELERGDGRAQLVRGDGQELVALAHLVLRLAPQARAAPRASSAR